MIDFPYIGDICRKTRSKIVMLVVDGLGGLAHPDTGLSELDAARLPNLDRLAGRSSCGLTDPVAPGITPGSGPGHMALFGYDPVKYLLGRGVLEAVGIGAELTDRDVAARGNFATVDSEGRLVDRRAGRIPTAESAPLARLLDRIQLSDVEVSVLPVRDYRFVLLMRGDGLGAAVRETDPQDLGLPPLEARPLDAGSSATASAANSFVSAAAAVLAGRSTANSVLLRGFSKLPTLPLFGATYKLNPAAIAAYPMYRGLAGIVGMEVLQTGQTFSEQLDTLESHFDEHDFLFLHYKPADAAGEDGDFDAKVSRLEELDALMPRLVEMGADALVVAGDHASPAVLGGHGWHPVPLLVHSALTVGEGIDSFTERDCARGSLGRLAATSVIMLALAHAGKLSKFGP